MNAPRSKLKHPRLIFLEGNYSAIAQWHTDGTDCTDFHGFLLKKIKICVNPFNLCYLCAIPLSA